jgi:hypothetical protein
MASGWREMETRGRWHDTGFVRPRPDTQQLPMDRVLISCEREGPTAHFYAEELDSFGNGTSVWQSRPFSVNPWSLRLSPTYEARAAHEDLLKCLYSCGWTTAGDARPEWYAQVLQRPGD